MMASSSVPVVRKTQFTNRNIFGDNHYNVYNGIPTPLQALKIFSASASLLLIIALKRRREDKSKRLLLDRKSTSNRAQIVHFRAFSIKMHKMVI